MQDFTKIINDLCRVGGLPKEEFEDIVRIGVRQAKENGFDIIIRSEKNEACKDEVNACQWNKDYPESHKGRNIIICRWLFDKKTEKWEDNGGLKFLWALFHEVGHSMDKPQTVQRPDLDREIFAWGKARELLNFFFIQNDSQDDFEKIAKSELQAHKEYFNSMKE